jgi:hypothetical protein
MKPFSFKDTFFELPSGGKYLGIPLPMGRSVKIKPFLVGDQKSMTGGGDPYKLYYNFMT